MNYDVKEVCRHIINYSNEHNYDISNLKLQKLLYFIQANFLVKKEDHTPCFSEKIKAFDVGPIVPEANCEYKMYGSGNIPYIKSYILINKDNIFNSKKVLFFDNIITDEDKTLIDEVIDKFADYASTDLLALIHKQSPWINAYTHQNNEITIEAIKKYFQK